MARRLHSEAGFTIVEVVIAGFIAILTGAAVLGVVNASTRNTFRAQQSQVISDRLQREVEQIKQLPYDQVALTSAPSHATNPVSPNFRVSGTGFAVNKNNTNVKPLAYNGGTIPVVGGTVSGGQVAPGGPGDSSAQFTSGHVKGTVYRYVVWDTDSSCPSPAKPCLKRAVVAVSLDTTASGGAAASRGSYQQLSTQIFDPTAKRSGTNPTGGPNTTPWTFFLTDTPCNNATRQPITVVGSTDGHPAHNTRGVCSTGKKDNADCTVVLTITQCRPGAPDLMYTTAQYDSSTQPLYDYATDVEPASPPTNTDKGLQETNVSGCNVLDPIFSSIPVVGSLTDGQNYLKIHKWLSNPVPSGFNNILFQGSATLNLWTQTVNNGVYSGGICVWLFTRHTVAGLPVDTPVLGGAVDYFTYQQTPWPNGSWQEIRVPMSFPVGIALPPNYQLGLAIAVNQPLTGGGLQFAYDAPSYDSRLSIDTTGSLPF